MSIETNHPDPTADWRKYPKSPNFLGIVIGASLFMLAVFVVAYFVLRADGSRMIPHNPNPTPNSLVQPLLTRPASALPA